MDGAYQTTQGDFIREEGRREALMLGGDTIQFVAELGLKELHRKALKRRTEELITDCQMQLVQYRQHMQGLQDDVQQKIENPQMDKEAEREVGRSLKMMRDTMTSFTRRTCDVLTWCLQRLRKEGTLGLRVDNFMLEVNAVDAEVNRSMKKVAASLHDRMLDNEVTHPDGSSCHDAEDEHEEQQEVIANQRPRTRTERRNDGSSLVKDRPLSPFRSPSRASCERKSNRAKRSTVHESGPYQSKEYDRRQAERKKQRRQDDDGLEVGPNCRIFISDGSGSDCEGTGDRNRFLSTRSFFEEGSDGEEAYEGAVDVSDGESGLEESQDAEPDSEDRRSPGGLVAACALRRDAEGSQLGQGSTVCTEEKQTAPRKATGPSKGQASKEHTKWGGDLAAGSLLQTINANSSRPRKRPKSGSQQTRYGQPFLENSNGTDNRDLEDVGTWPQEDSSSNGSKNTSPEASEDEIHYGMADGHRSRCRAEAWGPLLEDDMSGPDSPYSGVPERTDVVCRQRVQRLEVSRYVDRLQLRSDSNASCNQNCFSTGYGSAGGLPPREFWGRRAQPRANLHDRRRRGSAEADQFTPADVGEDIMATLEDGSSQWEQLTAPAKLMAQFVGHRPLGDLEAQNFEAILRQLDGLPVKYRSNWLLQPQPFLSARLFTRLSMCLARAASSKRKSMVGILSEGLNAVSHHLRQYAVHYSTQELRQLVQLLRNQADALELRYCIHGLLTDNRPLRELTLCLYSHVLEWFALLTQLPTPARNAPSARGPLSAARLIAEQYVHYVLCQLIECHLKDPLRLRLDLRAPDNHYYSPIDANLVCLWLQIFLYLDHLSDSDPGLSFWNCLLQVLRARVPSISLLRSLADLRALQRTESLCNLIRISGSGEASMPALDLDYAEQLWQLVLGLTRLELLIGRMEAAQGMQCKHAPPQTLSRGARWSLLEILVGPRTLGLSRIKPWPANEVAMLDQATADLCPTQQMTLIARRMQTMLRAWTPEGDLVQRFWLRVIQFSAFRLARPPVTTPEVLFLNKVRKLIVRGAKAADWATDWSEPSRWFGSLTQQSVGSLPWYLIVLPPEMLGNLHQAQRVRNLVDRGSDELLLLACSLLASSLKAQGSDLAQTELLRSLLHRLDPQPSPQASESSLQLPGLLGRQSMAQALLMQRRADQAGHRSLMQFWRESLRQSSAWSRPGCGSGATEQSRWEALMALSIQFLIHIGPCTASKPNFVHWPSVFRFLNEWLVSVHSTCTAMAVDRLAAPDLPPEGRYSPVLLWSILQAWICLLQLVAAFPVTSQQTHDVWHLSAQYLKDCRELDEALLDLLLRIYHSLCPLPLSKLPSLSKGTDFLPVMVAAAELEELEAHSSLLQRCRLKVDPQIQQKETGMPLAVLIRLARESWEALAHTSTLELYGQAQPSDREERKRVQLARCALPAQRALASAFALNPQKSRVENFTLLRMSLESKSSSYQDEQATTLRLWAPCFFDVYLAYQLPSYPVLEGQETALLASWIGLTIESASWKPLARSWKSMSKCMSELQLRLDNYLLCRFWSYTARLWTHLANLDRCGDTQSFAKIVDCSVIGREVPLPTFKLSHTAAELVYRAVFLVTVFLNSHRALSGATPVTRSLQAQTQASTLSHFVGATRRLLGSASNPRPLYIRRLAYTFTSVFLRFNIEIHKKTSILEDLSPALFGPFLGSSALLHSQSRHERQLSLMLMAEYLGDWLRGISCKAYTKDPLCEWLQYLSTKGMELAATSPKVFQVFCQALANGLWHFCPCSVRRHSAVQSRSYTQILHRIALLDPSTQWIREYESQRNHNHLRFFRWQFLFNLDLPTALLPPGYDGRVEIPCLHKDQLDRPSILLAFLIALYTPACHCTRTPPEQLGLCPSQELFPVLIALMGLLLGPRKSLTCPLYIPSLALAHRLLAIRIEGTEQAVWHWAGEVHAEPWPSPEGQLTRTGPHSCHTDCEKMLQELVRYWGALVGLQCALRSSADRSENKLGMKGEEGKEDMGRDGAVLRGQCLERVIGISREVLQMREKNLYTIRTFAFNSKAREDVELKDMLAADTSGIQARADTAIVKGDPPATESLPERSVEEVQYVAALNALLLSQPGVWHDDMTVYQRYIQRIYRGGSI